MILAIVGSRVANLEESEKVIEKYLDELNPSEVVSGGADGVDKLGVKIALERGITIRVFLPDSQNWKGFAKRNTKIAEYCDSLLCIVSKKSRTYGSQWTARKAKDLGKKIIKVTVN